MLKDRNIIGFLAITFCVTFLITFPGFFFSVDELSYFSRALAFSEFQTDLLQPTISGGTFSWAPAAYPLGTAFFLSFFCLISKDTIFLSGLFYSLIALFLVYKTLVKLGNTNYFPFLVFFVFPPTIYFSRGLMSEMPSLLVISLFTFFLFAKKESIINYLILGFLAGFSVWFRETNLIICGGLVLISLLKNPKYILPFLIGLGIGILPRILSSEFVYEQVAYVKNYPSFSLKYFMHNLPLYLIITTILLPAGLFVLLKYKGKLANSVKLSLGFFLAVHLVYGYNSGDHSGFLVSLFYNGRYFIPTLPLWMIVYAYSAKSNSNFEKPSIKLILTSACFLFIVIFSSFLFYLEKEHKKVATAIFEKYNDSVILYDNAAYRYLNPLHGEINKLEDYKLFREANFELKEEAVLVLSHKSTTENQIKFWENEKNKISKLNANIDVKQVENYSVFDGTEINVFKLSPQ